MAAGMGSRYGGVKQIDGVGLDNEALLDYSTYDALRSGFGKIVYIIRKDIEKDFRDRIFDRVARHCDASYVFQEMSTLLTPQQIAQSKDRTKPWGTVHAVLSAKEELNAPFCVINSDDYYGIDPFRTMADHLSGVGIDSLEHAMVGYVLRNTTSRSGSVSRAICEVKDGHLASMRENKTIYHEGDSIYSDIDGEKRLLRGDEWVSMNYFGYTPMAVDYLSEYFDRFIKENVGTAKEECYLPEASSQMIRTTDARMKFYTTEEKWFGMTYQEDRENVKREIAAMIDKGLYPRKLWT